MNQALYIRISSMISVSLSLLFLLGIAYIGYRFTLTCNSPFFLKTNADITKCVQFNKSIVNNETRILAKYTGPKKNYEGYLVIEVTCLVS